MKLLQSRISQLPLLRRGVQLAFLWGILSAPFVRAQAAVIRVKANAPGYNAGTSWEFAFTNLQQALEWAQPGDELWVARGTYRPLETETTCGVFRVSDGKTVYGGFAGTETTREQRDWQLNPTILTGNPTCYRSVVYVVPGSNNTNVQRLDGFVITGANNVYPTGGSDRGGALFAEGWSIVANCQIDSNTGQDAGGAVVEGYSMGPQPLVTNCVFSGNLARGGGYVNVTGGLRAARATVVACEFRNNRVNATDPGTGGSCALLVIGCDVINCVIYDNTEFTGTQLPAEIGRGIYALGLGDRPSRLINCTVVGNAPPAAYFTNGVAIENSIIWGTHSPITGSVVARHSTFPGPVAGPGNSSAAPLFVNAALKNFRLALGSPGIDDGDNLALPSWLGEDFDGALRVIDGNVAGARVVDRGAFEFGNWAAFRSIHRPANGTAILNFHGRSPNGFWLDRKTGAGTWAELGWLPASDSELHYEDDPSPGDPVVIYRVRLP